MSTAMHHRRPRVVVADDSALMRRIVTDSLERGGVEVVGSAANGDEALALCERERPDAMTLDLTMPGLDGIDVLRALRRAASAERARSSSSRRSRPPTAPAPSTRWPRAPLSSSPSRTAAPERSTPSSESLLSKVAGAAHRLRRRQPARGRPVPLAPARRRSTPGARRRARRRGAGRECRRDRHARRAARARSPSCCPSCPSPLGAGTLIVQHMPAGFTASLAARLDRASALSVREAGGGERLDPRVALVAPGGRHLRLATTAALRLTDEDAARRPAPARRPADRRRRPAASASSWCSSCLPGWATTACAAPSEVRRRGGRILVEAEETCTVYGMPRAIAEAHLAD